MIRDVFEPGMCGRRHTKMEIGDVSFLLSKQISEPFLLSMLSIMIHILDVVDVVTVVCKQQIKYGISYIVQRTVLATPDSFAGFRSAFACFLEKSVDFICAGAAAASVICTCFERNAREQCSESAWMMHVYLFS